MATDCTGKARVCQSVRVRGQHRRLLKTGSTSGFYFRFLNLFSKKLKYTDIHVIMEWYKCLSTIIQFLIGVLTPIILIGGIIAVLNELIQSFEKKEEYNRKLEELEEEIKEFSSQNQTLVEDCKSTIREIELEHQKTIQSLSRCSQSLYNEANAVLKNTHDLMIINGLLSERIQTLLKYATTSLEPEQESKLIEEITSAINHIKMENEQIAHHRQELEKAMRDIEQHDLEVAQKQELKEIQGHHFGGLSI